MGKIAAVGVLITCFAGVANASDDNLELGQREYINSCAVCHGRDGKAQSRTVDPLKVAPSDLTQLSKKNAGVFPTARIYETLDGRLSVTAHGSREMPIWGQIYTLQAAAKSDNPYVTESLVRTRILALIDFLYQLQEKP